MSMCRCCGQQISSAANTVIRVDEALLALCNRAHEEARMRGAFEVDIAHLAWVMVRTRELQEALEAFGCPVWALSEALEGEFERLFDVEAIAPRTSTQLKSLLGRAEAHAVRDGRTYAGPFDAIAVLVHEGDDLASAAFMRRVAVLSARSDIAGSRPEPYKPEPYTSPRRAEENGGAHGRADADVSHSRTRPADTTHMNGAFYDSSHEMRALVARLEKHERLLEQLVETFSTYARTSEERERERARDAARAQRDVREAREDAERGREDRRAKAHARWHRRRSWHSLSSWRNGNGRASRNWANLRRASLQNGERSIDSSRDVQDRLAHDRLRGSAADGFAERQLNGAASGFANTNAPTPRAVEVTSRRAFEAAPLDETDADHDIDTDIETEADDTVPSAEREKRFYLALDDDIERAPSIGARTAAYLSRAGIFKVRQLLTCNPESAAAQIGVRYITAQRLALWQAQSRLVCTVPWLRGTHAQLLAGAGFDTIEKIERADKATVCAAILQFAGTRDGQSVLRSGAPPDLARVGRWVEAAGLAEPGRAAA